MDVKRDPAILRQKKIRQGIFIAIGVVVLGGVSVAVSKLKPAAPLMPAGVPWIEPVKRGEMIRNVHGSGTLVPEDIRWLTATTSGRVESIVLRPGATVKPESVILVLSNPDLNQNARNAELSWRAAEAQLENQRASLRTQRATQENAVKDAESQFNFVQVDLDANKQLLNEGLVGQLVVKSKRQRRRVATAWTWRAAARDREGERDVAAGTAAGGRQPAEGQLRQFQRQLEDLKVGPA